MAGIPSIPKINRFLTSVSTSGSVSPEAAYIAAITSAGATVTAPQRAAISTFMSAEIAAGRWDGIKRLYFPVWGLAAANAICMKSLTSATFVGAFTHASGYIQGGSNKYIVVPSLTDMGLTVESHHITAIVKTPTTINYSVLINGAGLSTAYTEEDYTVALQGVTVSSGLQNATSYYFGILTFGGTRNSRYHKMRQISSLEYLPTTSTSVPGNFSNGVPTTLMGTASSNYWFGQIGGFSFSNYMSDEQDTAYTLALKTLWESTTGLTLP